MVDSSNALTSAPVPYTDERGLRDYRSAIADAARRWPPVLQPWFIAIAFLIGFALGARFGALGLL
jgi:hypothetical protein